MIEAAHSGIRTSVDITPTEAGPNAVGVFLIPVTLRSPGRSY
jgi:hypothetical protein